MTSNLLLANAGIPLSAVTIASNNTPDTTWPKENLFGGNKTDFFRLATATSGDTRLTFTTLGQTANFLYLGKAASLQSASVGTITIKGHGSDNYGAATTVHTVASFGAQSVVGPGLDDYITTFTTSASWDYWYVNYNATTDSKIDHAKLFFGAYFDPGKDPTGEVVATRIRPVGGRRRAAYTLEISWEGISYANAVLMYQRFYRGRRHNPIILFTTSYHDILFGHRVLFGRVMEMTVPPRSTGYVDASMIFEEVL